MPTLRFVFRVKIGLPLLVLDRTADRPASLEFPSGNSVTIEPIGRQAACDSRSFEIAIRVERECKAEPDGTWAEIEELSIPQDGAMALWRLLENLRVTHAARRRSAPVYPFARANEIRNHPLVRSCTAEWSFGEGKVMAVPLGGVPVVRIDDGEWAEVVRRTEAGTEPARHVSLALDGVFFATSGDPARGIIMACAAWEIALRTFLGDHCRVGVQDLYDRAVERRGEVPFADTDDSLSVFDREGARKLLRDLLPQWRNTILHGKDLEIPWDKAAEAALVVADAVTWLFGSPPDEARRVFPSSESG